MYEGKEQGSSSGKWLRCVCAVCVPATEKAFYEEVGFEIRRISNLVGGGGGGMGGGRWGVGNPIGKGGTGQAES